MTNPVVTEESVAALIPAEPIMAAPIEPAETPVEAAPMAIEDPVIKEEPESVVDEPAVIAASAPVFVQSTPIDIDRKPTSFTAEHDTYVSDGEFYVTVIEEKNVGTRNALLLGTLGVMIVGLMIGVVVSLFMKDLEVGSINDDIFNALLIDLEPMTVEEEIEKKNKDDGGGGGGGGREEKEETTKGDLADQTPDPIRPPDAKIPRLDNPALVLPPPSTEGNQKFKKDNQVWGDPNGRFANFSNGTGTGGGQGSGDGTGQGSGRGTGAGSGTGSGYGGGLGNGNGNGTGDGDGSTGAPPPPRPVGVTQAVKILSKPKPPYTDAARTNAIQGLVVLRVVFLASGQVGSVTTVKGLPNGLTESAIAAAKRISFEPAKRDGVPQSVTKTVEYNFGIY